MLPRWGGAWRPQLQFPWPHWSASTHSCLLVSALINVPGQFYPSSLGLTRRPNVPRTKGSSLDLYWARTLKTFAHKRRKVQTSNCPARTPCTILGHKNLPDVFLDTIRASLVICNPLCHVIWDAFLLPASSQESWTLVAKNRLQKAKWKVTIFKEPSDFPEIFGTQPWPQVSLLQMNLWQLHEGRDCVCLVHCCLTTQSTGLKYS